MVDSPIQFPGGDNEIEVFSTGDRQLIIDRLGSAAEAAQQIMAAMKKFLNDAVGEATNLRIECEAKIAQFVREQTSEAKVLQAAMQGNFEAFVRDAIAASLQELDRIGCAGIEFPSDDLPKTPIDPGGIPGPLPELPEPHRPEFPEETPETPEFSPEGNGEESDADDLTRFETDDEQPIDDAIPPSIPPSDVPEPLIPTDDLPSDTCPICEEVHDRSTCCATGAITLTINHDEKFYDIQFGDIDTKIITTREVAEEAPRDLLGQFCVYYSKSFKTCYRIPEGGKPRDPEDVLTGCGIEADAAIMMASQVCQALPFELTGDTSTRGSIFRADPFRPLQKTPGDTPSTGPPGDAAGYCAVDFYNQYVTGIPGVKALHLVSTFAPESISPLQQLTSMFGPFFSRLFGKDASTSMSEAVFKFAGEVINASLESLAGGIQCDFTDLLPLLPQRVLGEFLGQWVGPAFSDLALPFTQAARATCPTLIPDASQSVEAWLAGKINKSTLEGWTAANNFCWAQFEKFADATERKLTPEDIAILRRREVLNPTEYRDRIRELGFVNSDRPGEVMRLTEALPGMTDLIHMMVRDVADERLVAKFKLDSQFKDKWKGKLARWGLDQGVSEDVARMNWRAHWIIPAPQQLFEMLHRLRNLPEGDPAKIDEETVREALIQQDILPFYIDKFLAISFNPLTRIDVRRAFNIGALKRDEVLASYQKLGYNDANAEVMTDFSERLKNERIFNDRDVRLFKKAIIDETELKERLDEKGFKDKFIKTVIFDIRSEWALEKGLRKYKSDQWDRTETEEFFDVVELDTDAYTRLLDEIDEGRKNESAKVCAAALQKRFLMGEFDADMLAAELGELEIGQRRIKEMVKAAECLLSAQGKQLSLSQLCTEFKNGALQPLGFKDRLLNLGYDEDDAWILVTQCMTVHGQSLAKKAEAFRKDQEREIKREAQLAKRAEKTFEQEGRKATQRSQAASTLQARRTKALLKAADLLRSKLGVDLETAAAEIDRLWKLVKNNFSFNQSQMIQAVQVGVELWDAESGISIEDSILQSARAVQEVAFV